MSALRNIGLALLVAITILGLALPWARSGSGQSFDKLSAEDRQAFGERFAREVWPLMERGGKDGCVGCHAGKVVSALHLKGNVVKDFPMLLKEGFFIPDDAGSLLSRIIERDARRRMPPGKRPAWTEKEVEVLRAFVADLDRKQKK